MIDCVTCGACNTTLSFDGSFRCESCHAAWVRATHGACRICATFAYLCAKSGQCRSCWISTRREDRPERHTGGRHPILICPNCGLDRTRTNNGTYKCLPCVNARRIALRAAMTPTVLAVAS